MRVLILLTLVTILTSCATTPVSVENKVRKGYGFLDKNGKLLFHKTFEAAGSFSEGLAPVGRYKKTSAITGKMEYYFINRNGEKAIDNYYKATFGFSEGLAPVVIDDNCGFVDKSGKLVIKNKFSLVGIFKEGLAFASTKETGGFINISGEWVIKIPEKKSNVNSAENYEGIYYGDPSQFSEGIAKVCYDKFLKHICFYINKEGKKLFDGQEYSYATDFKNGLAVVGDAGLVTINTHLIDKSGNKITLKQDTKHNITEVSEDIAFIQSHSSFFINIKTQKRITKENYSIASKFSEELACVMDDRGLGYINKEGIYAIKPVYMPALDNVGLGTCSEFNEERATVLNKKNQMLFIVPKGNEITPEYPINYAGHFNNGIINVHFRDDNYPNRKKKRPKS